MTVVIVLFDVGFALAGPKARDAGPPEAPRPQRLVFERVPIRATLQPPPGATNASDAGSTVAGSD